MARYVRKNGQFVNVTTGEPMHKPYEGQICTPMVVRDIPEYRSPIDGKLITSRSSRREDLKRNGCVEYEPSLSPTGGKPSFKNERFAKKHGLPVAGKQ